MTDKIDDGGPAFPVVDEDGTSSRGMSLRDWFAGQALAGALANSNDGYSPNDAAVWAYAISDAMLAARAKGGAK